MSDQLKSVLAKVHGMTPVQLAQLEKAFERAAHIQRQQERGRAPCRVDRLVEHYERLQAKIQAKPDHPKIERWKIRLKEYETSLRNWDKFGQEKPPGPKAGVTIDVPLGRLGLNGG